MNRATAGGAKSNVDDPNDLLAIIAGRDTTGLFEFRCRDPHSRKGSSIAKRAWIPLQDMDACNRFIARYAERFDVWVGAAPRLNPGTGGKANIRHAWCLWVDCDEEKSAGCVERLMAFRPAPTMIIRSGSGVNCHAWWALTEPIGQWWAERANERLRYHLDPSLSLDKCSNFDRVLRPPMTFNHKQSPPTPVTVEYVRRESVVPVDRIVARLPDPRIKPVRRRPLRSDVAASDPLLGISADRYYTVLTGRETSYGNVTCPFHSGGNERSPSMRLYETTFCCFACGAAGSIYQFGSRLWDIPNRGADFHRLRERLTEVLI